MKIGRFNDQVGEVFIQQSQRFDVSTSQLKKPSFGQQSTLPQKKILGFVGQDERAICLIDGVLDTPFTRQKTRSRESGVPMWIYHAVARNLNSLLDLIEQSPTIIHATLGKTDSR
jgi:hypothetical protein